MWIRRHGNGSRAPARGQALLEFALVLPVLLLVTLIVIDAARVFGANVTVVNAAREAAIYASLNATAGQSEVAAHIAAETADLDSSRLTVGAPSRTAQFVSVTVTYTVPLVTPLIGSLWGNPVVLTTTSAAPVLQ